MWCDDDMQDILSVIVMMLYMTYQSLLYFEAKQVHRVMMPCQSIWSYDAKEDMQEDAFCDAKQAMQLYKLLCYALL